MASRVQILYDGDDITQYVMVASAHFEMLIGAQPGTCEFTCVDREQTLSFVTGKEIQLKVDGFFVWGGYLTSVSRKFAFPAVDTTDPDEVTQRQWVLRGVDYNILFDKRFLRNEDDYYHSLPNTTGDRYDGYLLKHALVDSKYFDVDGFDVTSEIDNVTYPFDPEIPGVSAGADPDRVGAWPQQGTPLRDLFQSMVAISGAVYYIDANKTFHYHALEDVESRWGFSDLPNNDPITSSPVEFQGTTVGFREIDATEDGSVIVNDALVWGGSEWEGSGGTAFDRETNATSISTHGRWQVAETHFGEEFYKVQSEVTARARAIVRGEPGASADGVEKGLRYPQWNIALVWFAEDVPRLSGVPDHLKAGDIVTIILNTFPVNRLLPLRSLSISFVGTRPPTGSYDPATDEIAYVQFRGAFSLQNSDPYTLWRFLTATQAEARHKRGAITTVDGSNASQYGSLFTGAPEPDPDGSTTVFDLPDGRGYISKTTYVWKGTSTENGRLLRRGTDYTESDPEAGEITLTTAPSGTEWLWVSARVT